MFANIFSYCFLVRSNTEEFSFFYHRWSLGSEILYTTLPNKSDNNFGTSIGVAVDHRSGIYWQRCKLTAIFGMSVGVAVDCRVLFLYNGSSNEKVSLARVSLISRGGRSKLCTWLSIVMNWPWMTLQAVGGAPCAAARLVYFLSCHYGWVGSLEKTRLILVRSQLNCFEIKKLKAKLAEIYKSCIEPGVWSMLSN